jgi:hypothetical protein
VHRSYDGNGEDECVSTCSHAAHERCYMAGRRRTGLVRLRWTTRCVKIKRVNRSKRAALFAAVRVLGWAPY